MGLPEDCTLTYIISNEAWYTQAAERAGLWVHASADGGGVAWEFGVEEFDLNGPTVQVKLFSDAFAAFTQIPEFFAALAELHDTEHGNRAPNVTLGDVRRILDRLGATDRTERVNPYSSRRPNPSVDQLTAALTEIADSPCPTVDPRGTCPVCIARAALAATEDPPAAHQKQEN